jgi:hypothetical protein
VNVHAKSRLILEPLRTLRSEDKGQAGACPDRTRAIPCTVQAFTGRPGATAANTVAMTADNTRHVWTTVEYRPSARTGIDGPGRLASAYGSEGWGFESLRARPAHRPAARPAAGFLLTDLLTAAMSSAWIERAKISAASAT